MELYYIWFWVGIIFLIVEVLTFTFYWLAMAIASFIVALIVYLNWDTSFTIFQSLVFIFIATWFSLFAVKYLRPKKISKAVWLDSYIWANVKLEKVGDDWKIKIDWVDYLIDDDSISDIFEVWKKVKIIGHNSWSFKVELI